MLEDQPRHRLLPFSDRTVDHYQIPLLVCVLCFVLRHFSERCSVFAFFFAIHSAGRYTLWSVHGRLTSPALHKIAEPHGYGMGGNIDTAAIRFT